MASQHAFLRPVQSRVDDAAKRFPPEKPADGWLRIMRKALNMSGTQLGGLMGITRARVSQLEQAEIAGSASFKSMYAAAEAMGCRFVYAIVPPESADALIREQAVKMARDLAKSDDFAAALKERGLPATRKKVEIEELAEDIMARMPNDLWDAH